MMLGFYARAFVRSTEDPEKVVQALGNIIPTLDSKKLEIREHHGVYGNLFYSILYKGEKKEARKVWEHIWKNLDEEDRELLRNEIEKYVDEWGQLHLRLDKQSAFEGKLRLGTGGVIKLVFKLEAYPAKPENFLRVARELVER